jgi:hypothetical protein
MNNMTPIKATGMKGFLLWFKREQPNLYVVVAPKIAKKVPQAFSDYTDGGWKNAGMTRDQIINRENRQKALGAIYRGKPYTRRTRSEKFADYDFSSDIGGAISVDYTAALSADLSPITVDYSASLTGEMSGNDIYVSTPTPVNVPTVDTSSAANSGPSSAQVGQAVGAIIGTAAAVALTAQQASLQNQLVQQNLARAQAGLAPLNTSLNASGVPTIGSTGMSSTTLLLLLVALGGGALLLSGGSSTSSSHKKE